MEVLSEEAYAPAGVQQLVVRSPSLEREFVVVVSPPAAPLVPGMPKPAPGEKLPTVYALDGGYGVAGPLAQMQAMSGGMAPAYVVSLSYPPGQGRRDTDFLYRSVTENGRTYGGGGAAFRRFLTNELKPFLEARYPLDPARAVLFGHSFGGLFAANVLAEAPGSFQGYVIASASAWRDPELTQRLAAAAPDGGERRVFVAAGDQETPRMLEATRAIAAALGGPGSALKVETRIFERENHLSYYPKMVQAAYAWTLPSPVAMRVAVQAPPATLDSLVGVYVYDDGRRLTITRRSGGLVAAITTMPGETELLAETPRRFFVPGGFDVTFDFEGRRGRLAEAVRTRVGGAAEERARRAP